MKFTATSGELYANLQIVAKIIDPKSTNVVPVLNNILFELEGTRLTLCGADLNNRITTHIEVQAVDTNGSFMVPHRTLLDFLKDLPDQPVQLEVKTEAEYAARLEYSNGYFEFSAAEPSSFPENISLEQKTASVELEANAVLAGLNATKFATSTDERRPIMTGVLFDFKDDSLVFVASDGRYLVRHTNTKVQGAPVAQICVPKPICELLAGSLLPKESGLIRLTYDERHLHVELSRFTLTARLLDGKFPNYNSVIPPTSPFEVTVSHEALFFGSKRVSACANKASKLILLMIQEGVITLQSKDLDLSVAGQERVSCAVNVPDHNIRIGFDSDLLGKILSSLSADTISLSLADQTRAAVIRPLEEAEGVETLCLLIPLKLLSDR